MLKQLVLLLLFNTYSLCCLAAVLLSTVEEDELEMKLAKYANHIERGLRLTEYGAPVAIDNLFDQILSLPSDDQGQNVDSECLNGNELSEMDMCLTPSQAGMFTPVSVSAQAAVRKRRQASANGFSLWKNGVIPYLFNSTFPAPDRDAILGAMSEWEKTTCITFRPATREDADVVVFRDGRRCSTNIGHIGGEQIVTLAKNCRSRRILIHELGHVIGLIHEHQRHDRDKFVHVLLENVRNMSQERYQFSKLLSGSITDKAVKYDYTSVMHYGRNYFAKSPELTTLQTTERLFQDVIGRAEKPSFGDTETVNRLYKCSADCPPSLQCGEPCYLDNLCTCRCPAFLDKLYPNGTGLYQNSLLDSTCEFFASRGECTGNLKDTVRPLCAKTCQIHQVRHNISAAESWTQSLPANTNHVQSKPRGSFWGTRPEGHRLTGLSRNNAHNNDINSISDVNFLRNTEARVASLSIPAAQVLQQPGASSQQPYIQDQQFPPLPSMQSQAAHYLQHDIMNAALSDNLRAALQQSHRSHSSTDSSLLRSLILSHAYNDETSRLTNHDHLHGRQQSSGSNLNARHIQVTTKSPSTILKHLLSGESLSRQDPISGLSMWLSLSNGSQQRQRSQQQQYQQQQQNQMLRKGSQNYQGSFQIVPTTAMPRLDSQTLQEMLDATQAKVSAGQSAGGSNAWQVNAGIANRHSEIFNTQVTEMRNGALPDPYNPTGQHSVLPSGDFGVAEQRQKTLGSNHMGLSAVSADRPAGTVTLADFTGPEVGQSGATVSGIGGILNNSFTGPDSGRNLQTTGPSFMKQGVVPQNFVVSEQTPPMGNPVEQVFNEPWNLQVQETAPVVEVQPMGQAFQYFEPHQPQNNFDPLISQNSQFAQQQQAWDALGSPGASTANTERIMDTASFQQYQEPIDYHALEALQPPQMAYQHQDIVQVDSNNGNFAGQQLQQQQQLSSLFQIINMHQSFTDPLADNMTSMLGHVFSEANQNFSTLVSERAASENLNSTRYNPGLNSLFQDLKHASATDSLNETNCCPEANKNLSTEYYNSQVHHSQDGVLKRLSQVDSSHPDLATLMSEITSGSRYLSRSSGQSKPLYLFTSKFKLPKQNRNNSVQNRSMQSAFTNDRTVTATASGYEKSKAVQPTIAGDPPHGLHLADTGEVIDQARSHLVVDSYSVPVQTQQPISQIHSGISSSNDSPSDTAFLHQTHVT
ncbi:hypothetical protein BsWGS_03280 [Bradybaena similaris]